MSSAAVVIGASRVNTEYPLDSYHFGQAITIYTSCRFSINSFILLISICMHYMTLTSLILDWQLLNKKSKWHFMHSTDCQINVLHAFFRTGNKWIC